MCTLSSSVGKMFTAASVMMTTRSMAGTSMMKQWLMRRAVRRPVSRFTTAAISSSVCRLPFISISRLAFARQAHRGLGRGLAVRRVDQLVGGDVEAGLARPRPRCAPSGPTRIGLSRPICAASTAPRSELSSQGCATAQGVGVERLAARDQVLILLVFAGWHGTDALRMVGCMKRLPRPVLPKRVASSSRAWRFGGGAPARGAVTWAPAVP